MDSKSIDFLTNVNFEFNMGVSLSLTYYFLIRFNLIPRLMACIYIFQIGFSKFYVLFNRDFIKFSLFFSLNQC